MELLIAALATWEIVEIWHHSDLMAPWRARAELVENKLGKVLTCMFCLSPWVAMVTVILSLPSVVTPPEPMQVVCGVALNVAALLSMFVTYHCVKMLITVWPMYWLVFWSFCTGLFFNAFLLSLVYALSTVDNLVAGYWAIVTLLKLAMCAFAVARLANFFNDVSHNITRTPNQKGWWQHQMGGDPKTGFEEDHGRTTPTDPDEPPGSSSSVR